jgi:hypothetical protein
MLFAGAVACGHAQWVNYAQPGTPRTKDGKPDLAAPAPRAANSKPDLSGVWQVEPSPLSELTRLFGDLSTFSVPGDDASTFSKYLISILADYKPEEQPLRPEGARIWQRHNETGELHPTTRCLAAGVPMAQLIPIPFKILQTPGLTAMLFEGDGTYRQIYTDGRKPPADPEPLWLGYSVGKWEGETLVVDTTGFNDKSWLDAMGHPHSDTLHVTERFRRRDFGHLDVQVTIEDPKLYTRPFTVKFTHRLVPDSDILESFCAENEKDRAHMAKN